jgi:hypothetical protein
MDDSETRETEAHAEPPDSEPRELCSIATFFRIAADPRHLEALALTGRLASENDLVRSQHDRLQGSYYWLTKWQLVSPAIGTNPVIFAPCDVRRRAPKPSRKVPSAL